jgi:hypothetical protein
MGHPQIFVMRFGVDWEWQIVSPIQNLQFVGNDFNVAGGEIWIFCAWRARSDVTGNLNHVFTAQCMRLPRKLGVFLRPKHDLRQAFAIAEINENYTAVIAGDIYPPGQCDLPANVALAKRIAVVRAIHCDAQKYRVILSEAKNLASD